MENLQPLTLYSFLHSHVHYILLYCTLLNFWTTKLTFKALYLYCKGLASKRCSLCSPRAALVVLIHWFLFLLRSTPPAQTASPEHLTGSEGPIGAKSIQKGTQSFSCIRFISAMNISFGSRVSGAVVCPDERRERRGDEGSAWVGWVGRGGGGVRRLCRGKLRRPRFKRTSRREYAPSHLVPQRDPGVYSRRLALQSFLEVV